MNPYENKTDRPDGQPQAPGYGTGDNPYTSQTGYGQYHNPAAGQYMQQPGQTGQANQPDGQTQQTQQAQPVQTAQNVQAVQPVQPSSYSWGPQPGNGYYAQPGQPMQPVQPKPKKKGKAGKVFAKILAAVLACGMISLGSVGIFAAMIENGVVHVQAPENARETAAFTLYQKADSGQDASPTVTRPGGTTQEIAQKVIPSVVCVQNYQVRQQGMFGLGGYYTQGSQEDGELAPAGEGSGIIISADGYIVTNQHVIDGATNISVVTSEGVTYEAELVGEDTQTDLAVLKINTDDQLTPADFGDSDGLQVTDMVMAVGNPGGLQFNSSVTIGYISALNRPVTNGETGFMVNCIQTDAAINPGNSGGALVNEDGLVVGINSSKIAATEYEGMGFAIPSKVVQPIVSDLIEYGYVKDRAMLGITGSYLDRMNFYGLPQGFFVGAVVTDNAKASGLQMYDVITAVDDTQVTSAGTIAAYIAGKKPGDTVTLTVDRPLTGEAGVKLQLVLSENSGTSE